MLIFVKFIIFAICLSNFCLSEQPKSTREYINSKLKETKEFLIKLHSGLGNEAVVKKVNWEKLWSKTPTTRRPRAVSLSDRMFVVDGKRVLLIDSTPNAQSDNFRIVNELDLASTEDDVKFVKKFFWNGSFFLLVCQESVCTSYQGADMSSLAKRQIIQYNGLVPVDAYFFTQNDRVYLIISYNLNSPTNNAAPSKIYQWTGDSLNFTTEVLTPTARAVSTLKDNKSTILLFALEDNQYSGADMDIGCVVYELKNKDEIDFSTFLPNLASVTSIHPYSYGGNEFALLTSDDAFRGVFFWDGSGLEQWIEIPELQASSLVSVVNVRNETLLFVCNADALHVYRLVDRDCVHLNDLILSDGQRVVETAVWESGGAIMLALIKLNPDGTYPIELWQLTFHDEEKSAESINEAVDSEAVQQCLKELESLLEDRQPEIERMKESWSELSETSAEPLRISELVLDGEGVTLVELDNPEKLKVYSPTDINEDLTNLERNIDAMLDSSRKMNDDQDDDIFSRSAVVEEDVIVENLVVESLDIVYLNDRKFDTSEFLVSGMKQRFDSRLEADSIYVGNLEVSSLCGLGSDNWLRVNDTRRTRLENMLDRSTIDDDTITIDGDLTLDQLNAEIINGVNITDFLEDVFLVGERQEITGNLTYQGLAQVSKLTADLVNNVSPSLFFTRGTNQSLGDVCIETLSVSDLYVEKINGVPIDQAARMSQENVIKGKVTIGNFIITDQLTINENISLPINQTTQVYDEILVNGDVYVDNLRIESEASLTIGNDVLNSYNVRDIVENSWSRSSDQVIRSSVSLLKGASIDELSCRYLNGLAESDFLYVGQESLADLENVTFANFHFDTVAKASTGKVDNFYENTEDVIVFHRAVHFARLTVDNIIADSYNGIPISKIMKANDTLEFTGVTEFETVRVIGQMTVDDLRVNRINGEYSFPVHSALMTDQDFYVGTLEADVVNMTNVKVEKLNGHSVEDAVLAQMDLAKRVENVSLTIDGVLEIEGKLEVELINDQKPADYFNVYKDANLVDVIETKDIQNLRITEDLNVTTLNGLNLEEFFATALSRSGKQVITGEIEAKNAIVKSLYTEKINEKKMSELMYVDEPCVFRGNVLFSKLRVDGNVITKTVKGKLISEIQEELRQIPLSDATKLHVFGEVTWNESSSNVDSLSYLLSNAVTKNDNQIIKSSVTFEQSVNISSLRLKDEEAFVLRKIRDVVEDAVVKNPNGDPAVVDASKIFKKSVVVSDLEVTNDIDVDRVNDLDFKAVASQIFQKYNNDTVSGQVTFLGEVRIGNLMTSEKIHGVPLSALATKDKKMPENMYFERLVVQGNVSLFKLDGVEFDAFAKKRIDIREDNEIFEDVVFDDTVVVTNESLVYSVNGIRPTNLVQSDPTGAPIVISGRKVFMEDVSVLQDVETSSINGVNLNEMFENSISNDENVTIEGSLIFENVVEVMNSVVVYGRINNASVDQLIDNHLSQVRAAEDLFNKEKSFLDNSLLISANLFSPAKTLLYLEKDETLNIQLPGVYDVKCRETNSSTRLDVYAVESPEFCGLPVECPCRRQYVVEISPLGKSKISERTSPKIAFSFYESNGLFGARVVSESVSSSKQCSKQLNEPEITQVFWITIDNGIEKQSKEPLLEVNGFVADAQAFLVNDRLYLILAMFYDKVANSHAIDSLIYELDLKTEKANALQNIATDGAKALEVFRIIDIGIYMLIGCVKGKAESLLFKFKPDTREFQLVRSFLTGGSRHIGSVCGSHNSSFVILNNHDIEALQIFAYERDFDNFYEYQNLYFESRVTSLKVFYTGEFGKSDALITTTTKDGSFYIYEYMYIGKFQLKVSYWEEDIQVLAPFHYLNRQYLFAGLKYNSTIYEFIEQGVKIDEDLHH